MRFLHTADLHLGRQLHGVSLEADQEAILDQILAAVREHEVQALLIPGDVFDRANPSGDSIRRFNRFLRRLAEETQAALIMSSGNHDGADRIEAMAAFPDPSRALIRGAIAAQEPPMILSDDDGPVAIGQHDRGARIADMTQPASYHSRRSFRRKRPNGGSSEVHGTWVRNRPSGRNAPRSNTSRCPSCGAEVIVRAHNGGHLVNEAGPGLQHVRHPCFTIGDGMRKARCEKTGDLLDLIEINEGRADYPG